MKNYFYYISYFNTLKGENGFNVGDVEVARKSPIATMEDITAIREAIKNANPKIEGLTILNYQLLRVEEVEA